MPQTIRPIRPSERPAWFQAFAAAFYIWQHDPNALAAVRRHHFDPKRMIAAFDGDRIVGTFRTFGAKLTLPGGARVPVSSVTAVSVLPTHRRRGTLTRLMADDVARSVARGDAASVLISAEWPIYGRFGYGPATWHAQWTLRVRAAQLAGEPSGTVEILQPLQAREILPELYELHAAAQPGELSRPDEKWDVDLGLIELPGRPRWRGSIAVHRNTTGQLDGYARYRGEEVWPEGIPDNVLLLDELHGVTLAAELELWRYVLQMDLTATIRAETRREHEPLQWYLGDARAARVTALSDFLWLRPLDVERLLRSRRYDRDGELVIAVTDVVDGRPGPAAGRYRLAVSGGAGECVRTDAAPDLTIEARTLGAAILGGTRLVDASRSSATVEHRPGALAEADAILWTAAAPWCSTWF
ncbi:MAG TPA: GNAT family N-acetyltransferase [Patescibacteria group bacterium]|nr:GNAT family N-acetyltransferase [Patescibacteria group bacterium]